MPTPSGAHFRYHTGRRAVFVLRLLPCTGVRDVRNPTWISTKEFNLRGWFVIEGNEKTFIAIGKGDKTELVRINMELVRRSLSLLCI